MSGELIFEEPAVVSRSGPSEIRLWLVALREHPGQWAKFPERRAIGTGGQIKNGQYSGIRQGEFEAVCRECGPDKKAWIYARYVGAAAALAAPVFPLPTCTCGMNASNDWSPRCAVHEVSETVDGRTTITQPCGCVRTFTRRPNEVGSGRGDCPKHQLRSS